MELEFTPEALRAIAEKALERKSGARGLRAIIESVMTDTMYELPSMEGVKKCIITEDAVLKGEKPILIRGQITEKAHGARRKPCRKPSRRAHEKTRNGRKAVPLCFWRRAHRAHAKPKGKNARYHASLPSSASQ